MYGKNRYNPTNVNPTIARPSFAIKILDIFIPNFANTN
jgi:hypothetical protein